MWLGPCCVRRFSKKMWPRISRPAAEGVAVLQTALGRDRLGEFHAQAAIAALHADAPRAEETDWVEIVGWYDELLRLTESPVVQLNRAIAIGEAYGPVAGLAASATVDPGLPRHTAASAYLHEKAGDTLTAARLYADVARSAPNLADVTTSPDRQRGSIKRCVGEPVHLWVDSRIRPRASAALDGSRGLRCDGRPTIVSVLARGLPTAWRSRTRTLKSISRGIYSPWLTALVLERLVFTNLTVPV
jgi:hypothetical protein